MFKRATQGTLAINHVVDSIGRYYLPRYPFQLGNAIEKGDNFLRRSGGDVLSVIVVAFKGTAVKSKAQRPASALVLYGPGQRTLNRSPRPRRSAHRQLAQFVGGHGVPFSRAYASHEMQWQSFRWS